MQVSRKFPVVGSKHGGVAAKDGKERGLVRAVEPEYEKALSPRSSATIAICGHTVNFDFGKADDCALESPLRRANPRKNRPFELGRVFPQMWFTAFTGESERIHVQNGTRMRMRSGHNHAFRSNLQAR